MTDFGPFGDLIVLIVAALVPAIIYLAFVRSGERYGTQPWGPLLSSFLFGALVSTFVAAILEGILVGAGTAFSKAYPAPEFTFLNGNSTIGAFALVLVFAPLIEEALKGAGVARMGDSLRFIADGPVFGASVGLGFGFVETFLYGLGAYLVGGLEAGILLIAVRSLSSVLLHGSTTAEFGYGYARSKFNRRGAGTGSYYGLAVLMHGSFNLLASIGPLLLVLGFSQDISNYGALLALGVAIVYAFAAIEHIRSVVYREAFPGAGGFHPRYTPPPARRTTPPNR